jgi:hypothetical protein
MEVYSVGEDVEQKNFSLYLQVSVPGTSKVHEVEQK